MISSRMQPPDQSSRTNRARRCRDVQTARRCRNTSGILPLHARPSVFAALAATLAASARRPPPPRSSRSARCGGATSARLAPDAPVRWPASPASRTPSTPASTTAASGDRRTSAPTGCRSSTTSRPARSARSPSRRRIPSVIYVGTGAGIIRPDLAIGDGIYKSTDAGRTWQHLGLARQPDDRGDRRRSRQRRPAVRRCPGSSVRPEPRARRVPLHRWRTDLREGAVQGRLHQRQRSPARPAQSRMSSTRRSGRSNRASSRARDSGTPGWASSSRPTAERPGRSSPRGFRPILQANIAIAPSDPNILYAVDRAGTGADRLLQVHRRRRALVSGDSRPGRAGGTWRRTCGRSHGSAAATCRPSPSIPRIRKVVYSASTVMWRTLDGGLTWSAVRGAPGGDDYQRIWINPERHRRSSSPSPIRERWSPRIVDGAGATGTTRTRRRCITSPPTTRFPIASARDSRTRAARACKADRTTGASRSTTGIR